MLEYGTFLLVMVPAAIVVLLLSIRLYRVAWPPGPDDIPEFRRGS